MRLEDVVAGVAVAADPDVEHARLLTAITAAGAELDALAAADDEAAAILAFQTEMLSDPALAEPALMAIARGEAAAPAWRHAMAEQIAIYRHADDEYFRGRAADLADLALRVETILAGTTAAPEIPHGAILLAHDLGPSQLVALAPRLAGVALEHGNATSHTAILARGRGLPMVVGLGRTDGGRALIDGAAGTLTIDPSPSMCAALTAIRVPLPFGPVITAGGERVRLMLNVDHPDAIDDATLAASDGVGLWRTEMLFMGRDRPLDEGEQAAIYGSLVRRLGGKPCIVRTLDIGGDKPLPWLDLPREGNPFLGLRGIRLCLERPELWRPQLRALIRAGVQGPLSIMLPMVTVADEVAAARDLIGVLARELALPPPPLGIMVETPAAALALDTFTVDFLSIGSNDLIQYVTAAARDAAEPVAALADPCHPAITRLLREIALHGRRDGVPVSLCGDMASDPALVALLLQAGLRSLSVAPALLGSVAQAVAAWRGEA